MLEKKRKKRKTVSRVEEAGRRLATWLNSRSAIGHPVAKVILDMQGMIEYVRRLRADVWTDQFEVAEKIERRFARIRRITREYPMFLEPHGMDLRPDNLFFQLTPLSKSSRILEGCHALADWKVLADQGAQSRIRRCRYCPLFFYAKFAHQNFHNVKCKEKEKRSSPAFKKKRAEYMRGYYADNLSSKRTKGKA